MDARPSSMTGKKGFCFKLLVLRGHWFFSIPTTTANDLQLRSIPIPDFIHYFLSFLNS